MLRKVHNFNITTHLTSGVGDRNSDQTVQKQPTIGDREPVVYPDEISSLDLMRQLQELQERMNKKSKEFAELRNVIAQGFGSPPETPGEEAYPGTVCPCSIRGRYSGRFTSNKLSQLQLAVASLHTKCRVKDHMIASLLEELTMYSSNNPGQSDCGCLSIEAAPQVPNQGQTTSQQARLARGPGSDEPPHKVSGGKECYCAYAYFAKPKVFCHCNKDDTLQPKLCPKQNCGPSCKQGTNVGNCQCPSDFKILRRVGSDSLLLSWKIPPNDQVVGYEIYINGNLSLIIRSATRNKALLTTLNLQQKLVIFLYAVTKMGRGSKPLIAVYQQPPCGGDRICCFSP